MKQYQYEMEENCSKENFQRVIKRIFPEKKIIYALIPEYYNDFLLELSPKFVTIKKVEDDKNSYPKSEYTYGYVNDEELYFAFEFYERANLIPFVITNENVEFNEVVIDSDSFYNYFKKNNIPHITVGHDQEYLTFFNN
ncbi:hypothetical protein [Sutcliffiella halmapala]|uniref:hypothetical protein n=1 Tax=Sutcliffiella halmapala TaxID=79882 RepID=UPI000994EE83|nr:hypothetical protein [Sutcliffiella halmapala]